MGNDNEMNQYNGWSNYETWCVHLWLTNDERCYRFWMEEARDRRKEAREAEAVKEGIWSVERAPTYLLAEQLRREFDAENPIECPSPYADLLASALAEVDWHEVADAFLEELEPACE